MNPTIQKKKILVIVDAGHGSDTAGKRSTDGLLLEYAWARDCAHVLMPWLESKGYDVVYLVPEASEIDVPLPTSERRANAAYDKYDGKVVLVSLHCNAHGMGKEWTDAHGWSIFTTKGDTESDAIATSIYNAALKRFGKENMRQDFSDGDPDWESNFYILRKTKCPAVLIENFFMTNKQDCSYLLSFNSIQECSEVIVNGLENYYNEMASQN